MATDEKRRSNRARIASRSSRCAWAAAATASSMVATRKPVAPSSMISGVEPQAKATTGVPQAMASIITRPNGSGQSMGKSRASAPPRKADFRSSPISPTNSIRGLPWTSGLMTVSQ